MTSQLKKDYANTDKFFKGSKVNCARRIVVTDNVALAIPFNPINAKGRTLQNYKKKFEGAGDTKSTYRKDYAQKSIAHVGMVKKPLVPYNPNSNRNRLPTATVVMPHKNKSEIVLGDPSLNFNQNSKL